MKTVAGLFYGGAGGLAAKPQGALEGGRGKEGAREAELQKTREAGQQEKRELAALRQELTSRKETALQASREIDALQKSGQEFNAILGRLQEIRKKL